MAVGGVPRVRPAPFAGASVRDLRARATTLDVWAFLLPAISFVEVRLVGRLIVSELLALAILPWLLRSPDRLRVPRWLLALWAAWLVSQVLTDVVVGSAFVDWARGWAAIIFTLIDLTVILALVSTPNRGRIFAFGLAVGGILTYVFAPTPNALADPWKWAFAGPIGFALAAALSGVMGERRPWLAVTVFAAFGVLSAFLLYRSLSGVALLTAAYLLFAAVVAGRNQFRLRRPAQAAGGLIFYGAAALAIYLSLGAAAAGGLFGQAAKERFEDQSGAVTASSPLPVPSPVASTPAGTSTPVPTSSTVSGSNPLGVLIGGRSEILTSPRAILDSPILGHGSWAKDPKYVELQRRELIEMGVPNGNEPGDPALIPTHSYLLGSWVWAGLAGGVFWLAIAAIVLWLIAKLYTSTVALSPLIVFATTWLLWNIAFSPYGNTQRLYATFAIALCLLGLRLVEQIPATSQDNPDLRSRPSGA
jgi:hypothetical protein